MSFTVLQNKIEQKLDSLCMSLDTLKGQQKKLLHNEDKIKSCINTKTETHVHFLRRRERQLLRQVEVESAHQKSLIDSQIAELVHLKGYLTATQDILQKCKPEDILCLSRIVEPKMASLKSVSPLNLASVQFDGSSLSSAIKTFGLVHLSDTVAHHHATVIPAKMEDYGDSEQDVLHKSIEVPSEAPLIKVQFPKLPSHGWLAGPQRETKPPSSALRRLSHDVSSWLSDLRVSQSLEDAKTSFALDEDYYAVREAERGGLGAAHPCRKQRSRDTSVSSSIEVVQCPESDKDSCSQGESDFSCGKYNWVKCGDTPPTGKPSTKTTCPSIAIEDFACQANEPCDSYKDCVCDGYCMELATERADQTSKWLRKIDANNFENPPIVVSSPPQVGTKRNLSLMEGTAEVLNHMSQILNSNPNQWLSKKVCNKASRTFTSPNNFSITYNPPTKAWLCQRTATEGKTPPKETSPILSPLHSSANSSPHSSIWLLRKHKEELQTQKEKPSIAEPSDQDRSSEFNVSVNDLKGALAELSVMVPKFPTKASKASQDTYNLSQDTGREMQRKLKWLSRSADSTTSSPAGYVDLISRSPVFLPKSLVDLADSTLAKWLVDRL